MSQQVIRELNLEFRITGDESIPLPQMATKKPAKLVN